MRLLNLMIICVVLAMAHPKTTLANTADSGNYLSLAKAERLALRNDPKVAAALARARSFSEQGIADGQLSDPMLKFGLFNLPIDDFDLRKNPTTQLRLGVVQKFPRGDTRALKTLRAEWLSNAENAAAENTARNLLKTIRELWLEAWYQQQAQGVIDKNRTLFQQLTDITEGQYAAGRANQQDVLRADLELARLDDRLLKARKAEAAARSMLLRWVGDSARLPLPAEQPQIPAPADLDMLKPGLPEHPAITVKSAQLEAQERLVDIAREQYSPGWSLGGEYRQRFGDNPDGTSRESMIALMATIDLPMFTARRQDKQLAAAREKADAIWFTRQDALQQLQSELYWRLADEEELNNRLALYQNQLLKSAEANSEASLQAYQSGTTEFTALMRASITELDIQLQSLRVLVDLQKNHARLQWLAIDNNSYSSENQRQSERTAERQQAHSVEEGE
ncbi:MAG: TolC family protein [Proteobacteria bacterium]|nr:TolC family protein [Pseudomonadota bacterium]